MFPCYDILYYNETRSFLAKQNPGFICRHTSNLLICLYMVKIKRRTQGIQGTSRVVLVVSTVTHVFTFMYASKSYNHNPRARACHRSRLSLPLLLFKDFPEPATQMSLRGYSLNSWVSCWFFFSFSFFMVNERSDGYHSLCRAAASSGRRLLPSLQFSPP